MQCDICFRTGGKKLPFLCPTDARNRLYEPRIQHAHVLLEKDSLDKQITSFFSEDGKSTRGATPSRIDVTELAAEKDQAIDRTQQIIAHADELRANVDKAKEEIAKKKATINRRKSELASAANGIEAKRAKQIEDMDKYTRMGTYKWNHVHGITASSRAFLCGEAAKLYGLRGVRRDREEYRIGGIAIVDLGSMNTASPAQISTALSHIVHLLMLSTHYLAIRLPAEITLPHRDYPLPTILPIASSYKHTNVPFPGTTPGPSGNNSPTTSRQIPSEVPNLPRPRPLYTQKPLPLLSAEDPAAYGLFLEGVSLLAYDIAWLCKSQGIPVGDSTRIEDTFNIGKNFFNLLISSQSRPPPSSILSSQSRPTNGDEIQENKKSLMGRFSHGTAHSFLGSAQGTEFIRSWRLPSPMKIADNLKSKLLGEVANAEWEFLDQNAWAVDDEMGHDGVVVGARREEGERGKQLSISFMSMRTVVDAVEMVGAEDRKPGTSGWTKLKPR